MSGGGDRWRALRGPGVRMLVDTLGAPHRSRRRVTVLLGHEPHAPFKPQACNTHSAGPEAMVRLTARDLVDLRCPPSSAAVEETILPVVERVEAELGAFTAPDRALWPLD